MKHEVRGNGTTLCNTTMIVARITSISQEVLAKVSCCAEKVAHAVGPLPGRVLIIIFPYEKSGATVAHWQEKDVPRVIRDLAARVGARYIIFLPTGVLPWEPEKVEALLAHEIGHIALGHCDSKFYQFVTRARHLFLLKLLLLKKELEADRYAVRLGYGESLLEARRCSQNQRRPYILLNAFKVWWLCRQLKGASSVADQPRSTSTSKRKGSGNFVRHKL